ncbi:hypothetical protein K440DRAFT_664394 [Wilcoxina mikolae CBS 423.85]|nr:hypothetical protein K440DRAFT_664394 [Wilcoxina mikolae CBS 423.85]
MNPPTENHAFFSVPVRPNTKPIKRRRNSTSSNSSSSSSSSEAAATAATSLHSSPRTSWTPVNTHKHPAPLSPGALAPGESPPPDDSDPFHRLPTSRRGRHTAHPRTLLANHHLAPIPTPAWSLRRKHLSVITTILYRSLLSRDWARAERAFACLIRGKDVDIRRIWGVGVELLLRREQGGMKDAAEFLERLILFFPYRPRLHSHHPAVVAATKRKGKEKRLLPLDSAVEFQPALFSLLIEGSRYRDVAEGGEAGEEEEMEMSRPEKIKERLEELMLTPPWSDMEGLLCLRGMVCLWVADVELQRIVEGEDGDGDGGDVEGRRSVARELRVEARGYFKTVKEKGGRVPEGIEDALAVDEEDEEMVDV